MPCEGRKLLPKVISWARNFRCATNHFDCAGRALFHSRDWAGIDHAYGYDRNFYRSEYRYSSCSRSGSLSVAIAPVHCPFGIDLAENLLIEAEYRATCNDARAGRVCLRGD
jgi:hypothetical protein